MKRKNLREVEKIVVLEDIAEKTLSYARDCARTGECIVYWIGTIANNVGTVIEVIHPRHASSVIHARVVHADVAKVISRIHCEGRYLLAQVHTHPGTAFHSATDDSNPIIWEEGFRSIVIPYFGRVDTKSFMSDTAVFVQKPGGKWVEDCRSPPVVLRGGYDERLIHRTSLLANERGLPVDGYLESATNFPVGVAIDEDLATTHRGQLLAMTILNALIRMGFVPQFLVSGDVELHKDMSLSEGSMLSEVLPEQISLIRPSQIGRLQSMQTEDFELMIRIGQTNTGKGRSILYVDGAGWVAGIGRRALVDFEPEDLVNPIGPLISATFASSEAFKIFLNHTVGANIPVTNDMRFSALDYSLGSTNGADLELKSLHLPPVSLVGCGAIGSGFVLALSVVPGLSGELTVIDHDVVEATNLGRYAIPVAADLGRDKVVVIEDHIKSRLRVHAFPQKSQDIQAFSEKSIAVCCVDNVASRWDLQAKNPQTILNAGMHGDSFRLTRHVRAGSGPCLGCVYPISTDALGIQADYPASPYVSMRAGALLLGELVKELDDRYADYSITYAYIVNDALALPGENNAFVGFSNAVPNCPLDCKRDRSAEVGRSRQVPISEGGEKWGIPNSP